MEARKITDPVPCVTDSVVISAAAPRSRAELHLPDRPRGVIIEVPGRKEQRHFPRRDRLDESLMGAGLATLKLESPGPGTDLPPMPSQDDAARTLGVLEASKWLETDERTTGLPVGCIGFGSGASTALRAAARPESRIRAVVTLGGFPHGAGPALEAVGVPVLMLVAADDAEGEASARAAAAGLFARSSIIVLPGTSRRFTEPGALEELGRRAAQWLEENLAP